MGGVLTTTRTVHAAASLIGVFADLGYLGWDQGMITGRRKPRGKG